MADQVTFKNQPMALSGTLPKVGDSLPDCTLIDNDLKPIKLNSFKGKVLLILTVPSLDTGVCSKETAHFNQLLAGYSDRLEAITISLDLPFAQKRWCLAEKIKNVRTLSDYKEREVGKNLGVYIPDLGLLARAVFICSPEGKVQYVELVKEVTHEPHYERVLEKLEALLVAKKGK